MRNSLYASFRSLKPANSGALLILVFMLMSCSTIQQDSIVQDTQLELDHAIAREQAASQQIDMPDEVEATLFAADNLSAGGMGHPHYSRARDSARFDVSVKNIPANVFFLSLVADSGINVVTDPDISGRISLELNNVSVEDVLKVTRDIYGYEYRYSNGIYIIYSRKLRTQVFPINYIDVKRVGVTDTNVSIGEIRSSNGQNNGGNNNSNQNQQNNANLLGYLGDEQQASGGRGSNGFSPGARVQTLNKTDFWGSLQTTLSAIIGGESNGRMVMANPQAGLVVVNAMPRELAAVRDYLEKSKLSVARQVVLETKILEVRLSKGFEAGVNWGAISGALTLAQLSQDNQTVDRVIFNPDVSESVVSSVLNVTDITKLLRLLETQGDVKVLSSPRISTVNNQKALIRVGSDEFFVTGLTSSTVTNAATTTNQPTIELDSFFSGIALDVTPQIAEDGEVILHVHPIVTDVRDQQKDIVIGEDTFSLPLALRDVRESDSIVKAKSGQVVVLGGLMQETSTNQRGGRPGLSKVPIINSLFKTKQQSSSKTELVILMRPMVIDNDDWSAELGARRSSLEWFSNGSQD